MPEDNSILLNNAFPESPLLTVIIPTFNRPHTTARSLKSVIGQDYKNLEIIVVDDGSEVPVNAENLGVSDHRVKFLRIAENKGGGFARNVGIDAATGIYICFLDSDDYWEPKKISCQLDLMERNEDNIVIYNRVMIDYGRSKKYSPEYYLRDTGLLDRYITIEKQYMQTSGLLVSAELAKSVRFDDTLKKHQDIDFVLRLKNAGASFIFCDQPNVVFDNTSNEARVSLRKSPYPTMDFLDKCRSFLSRDVERFYILSIVAPSMITHSPYKALKLYRSSIYPIDRFFLKEMIDGLIRYNFSPKIYEFIRATYRRIVS